MARLLEREKLEGIRKGKIRRRGKGNEGRSVAPVFQSGDYGSIC